MFITHVRFQTYNSPTVLSLNFQGPWPPGGRTKHKTCFDYQTKAHLLCQTPLFTMSVNNAKRVLIFEQTILQNISYPHKPNLGT